MDNAPELSARDFNMPYKLLSELWHLQAVRYLPHIPPPIPIHFVSCFTFAENQLSAVSKDR